MSLLRAANNIIDRHGYDVSFSRPTAGASYDTATRRMTGGSPVTWKAKGVFLSYSENEIDGTSVLIDDRKLLLRSQPMEYAPSPGDVVDDAVQIISVRKMLSGTTVLGYVCQTRG